MSALDHLLRNAAIFRVHVGEYSAECQRLSQRVSCWDLNDNLAALGSDPEQFISRSESLLFALASLLWCPAVEDPDPERLADLNVDRVPIDNAEDGAELDEGAINIEGSDARLSANLNQMHDFGGLNGLIGTDEMLDAGKRYDGGTA